MVTVAIPNTLKGGSLGQAHAWVREQIVYSNPQKPMSDYALINAEGKKVSLSTIVNGDVDEITIEGVGNDVRSNPSAPGAMSSFTVLPPPMHGNRLTELLPAEIDPLLYTRAVEEYGHFGAVQTLSILLSRPAITSTPNYSPRTLALIQSRVGTSEPAHHAVRSNPTPDQVRGGVAGLGLGSYRGAVNSLSASGSLAAQSTQAIEHVRGLVDSFLDQGEQKMQADEGGALLSMANQMSMRYENSEKIFDTFAKDVLAPYLVTSTSNAYALEYINEYLIPKMKHIIEDGKNTDSNNRKLDRYYRYIVKHLATDPRDFYMGQELALIAHPGFLYKRAGLVLLPLPNTMKDPAFKAFSQAGEPPKYSAEGFIARNVDKGSLVKYVDKSTYKAIAEQTFQDSSALGRVFEMVDTLASKVDQYGEGDTHSFNLVVKAANALALKDLDAVYESIKGFPAFYFVDLPGIQPIPTNWPQKLIFAMMEVLADNRDRISGLGKKFEAADFLRPTGIHLTGSNFSANVNGFSETEIKDKLKKFKDIKKIGSGTKEQAQVKEVSKIIKDITDTMMHHQSASPEYIAAEAASNATEKKQVKYLNGLGPAGITSAFIEIVKNPAVNISAYVTKDLGDTPSIYKLVLDSVNLSISKYGYEPSRDDVWFMMTLLYYSLKNMGLDATVTTGFFTKITSLFSEARKKTFTEFTEKLEKDYKADSTLTISDEQLNKYAAIKFLRDALDDPNSDAYKTLGGLPLTVRSNPTPANTGPVMGTAEVEKMKILLDNTIGEYDKLFKEKFTTSGGGIGVEGVYDELKKLFDPEVLLRLSSENPLGLVHFAGDKVTESNSSVRDLIDNMYEGVHTGLKDVFKKTTELLPALTQLSAFGSSDLDADFDKFAQHLTHLSASFSALMIYTKQYDVYGGFVRHLGDSTGPGAKAEKDYVGKMGKFMRLLNTELKGLDNLLLTATGDAIPGAKKRGDPSFPAHFLAELTNEMLDLQPIIMAYDAAIPLYIEYASFKSSPDYTHHPKIKEDRQSSLRLTYASTIDDLFKVYSALFKDDDNGGFDNSFWKEFKGRPEYGSELDENDLTKEELCQGVNWGWQSDDYLGDLDGSTFFKSTLTPHFKVEFAVQHRFTPYITALLRESAWISASRLDQVAVNIQRQNEKRIDGIVADIKEGIEKGIKKADRRAKWKKRATKALTIPLVIPGAVGTAFVGGFAIGLEQFRNTWSTFKAESRKSRARAQNAATRFALELAVERARAKTVALYGMSIYESGTAIGIMEEAGGTTGMLAAGWSSLSQRKFNAKIQKSQIKELEQLLKLQKASIDELVNWANTLPYTRALLYKRLLDEVKDTSTKLDYLAVNYVGRPEALQAEMDKEAAELAKTNIETIAALKRGYKEDIAALRQKSAEKLDSVLKKRVKERSDYKSEIESLEEASELELKSLEEASELELKSLEEASELKLREEQLRYWGALDTVKAASEDQLREAQERYDLDMLEEAKERQRIIDQHQADLIALNKTHKLGTAAHEQAMRDLTAKQVGEIEALVEQQKLAQAVKEASIERLKQQNTGTEAKLTNAELLPQIIAAEKRLKDESRSPLKNKEKIEAAVSAYQLLLNAYTGEYKPRYGVGKKYDPRPRRNPIGGWDI